MFTFGRHWLDHHCARQGHHTDLGFGSDIPSFIPPSVKTMGHTEVHLGLLGSRSEYRPNSKDSVRRTPNTENTIIDRNSSQADQFHKAVC